MFAERSLLLNILNLTNSKRCEVKELREKSKITEELCQNILSSLDNQGLIENLGETVCVNINQRLRLATKAIEVGISLDKVAGTIGWLEFEEFSAKIFEENGFMVKRRFRFRALERRWEIDVLAVRRPYVISGEAKHWSRGMGNNIARGIIEDHLNKSRIFSNNIDELSQKIGINGWKNAIILPMALTLSATPFNIYRRVPCVSVVSLPSFLSEFDGQLERFETFSVNISDKKKIPRQIKLKRGGLAIGSKPSRHL